MDFKGIDISDLVEVHTVFDNLLDCQSKEDMAKHYDKIAPNYDMIADGDYFGPAETAAKLLEIEPNKNVCILDVGCGTGLVGKAIWDVGYLNLYGVDISESSLNIASEKGVYSKLINATFGPETPLSYKDGFFDVALSAGSFLPNHLDHTTLPEMIRLVKKGGYLLITTRKSLFENDEYGMKLRTNLLPLTETKILQKIFHEDVCYLKEVDLVGIALCYKVL